MRSSWDPFQTFPICEPASIGAATVRRTASQPASQQSRSPFSPGAARKGRVLPPAPKDYPARTAFAGCASERAPPRGSAGSPTSARRSGGWLASWGRRGRALLVPHLSCLGHVHPHRRSHSLHSERPMWLACLGTRRPRFSLFAFRFTLFAPVGPVPLVCARAYYRRSESDGSRSCSHLFHMICRMRPVSPDAFLSRSSGSGRRKSSRLIGTLPDLPYLHHSEARGSAVGVDFPQSPQSEASAIAVKVT